MELAERRLTLRQLHPGILLTRFGKPQRDALERVANDTGKSLEEINDILYGERDLTSNVREPLARYFGVPAEVLDLWQQHYDLLVRFWAHDTWLENAKLHLLGLKSFLEEIEFEIKMLKKDRDLVRKLIPARFRPKAT